MVGPLRFGIEPLRPVVESRQGGIGRLKLGTQPLLGAGESHRFGAEPFQGAVGLLCEAAMQHNVAFG